MFDLPNAFRKFAIVDESSEVAGVVYACYVKDLRMSFALELTS